MIGVVKYNACHDVCEEDFMRSVCLLLLCAVSCLFGFSCDTLRQVFDHEGVKRENRERQEIEQRETEARKTAEAKEKYRNFRSLAESRIEGWNKAVGLERSGRLDDALEAFKAIPAIDYIGSFIIQYGDIYLDEVKVAGDDGKFEKIVKANHDMDEALQDIEGRMSRKRASASKKRGFANEHFPKFMKYLTDSGHDKHFSQDIMADLANLRNALLGDCDDFEAHDAGKILYDELRAYIYDPDNFNEVFDPRTMEFGYVSESDDYTGFLKKSDIIATNDYATRTYAYALPPICFTIKDFLNEIDSGLRSVGFVPEYSGEYASIVGPTNHAAFDKMKIKGALIQFAFEGQNGERFVSESVPVAFIRQKHDFYDKHPCVFAGMGDISSVDRTALEVLENKFEEDGENDSKSKAIKDAVENIFKARAGMNVPITVGSVPFKDFKSIRIEKVNWILEE